MTQTKLHFARFEFKYILRRSVRDEFERELRYFMQFDPFVQEQMNNQYFVRSLYFDDPTYTCYFDKTDGLHTRSKFRIRAYTPKPEQSDVRFLEVKGRYNNLVFKHRVGIGGDQRKLDEARGEALADRLVAQADSGAVIDQFQFERFRKKLMPVVTVDYFRRPYVSKYDPGFRLTFDSQLTCRPASGLFCAKRQPRAILPGYTVMEVKFRYRMPAWFHRLIQSYELRRVSVSKVCRAMETTELVSNLE